MRMSYDAYMYYSHLNKLVNINMYFTAYIIYIITHTYIYIHILKSWANLPSWMIQIVGCRKVWLTSPGSTRPQLSSWVSQPALVILADRAVEFHLGWRQDWFRIVYACRRGKKTHGVELTNTYYDILTNAGANCNVDHIQRWDDCPTKKGNILLPSLTHDTNQQGDI